MPKLMNADEIQQALDKLKASWKYDGNQIETEVETKDFVSALKLANAVGEAAESMDHHPDLFIHSYNKLKITSSTHSEGGVTNNDLKLAEAIDQHLGNASTK